MAIVIMIRGLHPNVSGSATGLPDLVHVAWRRTMGRAGRGSVGVASLGLARRRRR